MKTPGDYSLHSGTPGSVTIHNHFATGAFATGAQNYMPGAFAAGAQNFAAGAQNFNIQPGAHIHTTSDEQQPRHREFEDSVGSVSHKPAPKKPPQSLRRGDIEDSDEDSYERVVKVAKKPPQSLRHRDDSHEDSYERVVKVAKKPPQSLRHLDDSDEDDSEPVSYKATLKSKKYATMPQYSDKDEDSDDESVGYKMSVVQPRRNKPHAKQKKTSGVTSTSKTTAKSPTVINGMIDGQKIGKYLTFDKLNSLTDEQIYSILRPLSEGEIKKAFTAKEIVTVCNRLKICVYNTDNKQTTSKKFHKAIKIHFA